MISEDARRVSSQCRHYAMCKIDFLGTGLCPSGPRKHYVSYYPQGRMDICSALARDFIPLTQALVDIADTCTLCGICDKQCHFVTGMRPTIAMKALKTHVETWLKEGREIETVKEDAVLTRLRGIVGGEWATNDPAILVAYSNDPFPLKDMKIPGYVVLPASRDEVIDIVKLANEYDLPYVVRGNGGSVFGLVFSEGIVMDMARMKSIVIDKENWVAMAEPGVTVFDAQREVYKHNFRINTAEPAATVCGNIVCTGIFSTWSNAYGVAADNLVNAEFVDNRGSVFNLADRTAPNLFAFRNEMMPPPPAICTKVHVKMYPTTDDEEGLIVPFARFDDAVSLAHELSKRRIGLALAVLGDHYLSTFMSPSADLADKVKTCLTGALGIGAVVFMVGDKYARDAVQKMAGATIDNRLFRMLMLGLPNLAQDEWIDLLRNFEGDKYTFEILCREEMYPLLEAVLSPSPETLAAAVPEDLRDFYAQLYARPEMTDLVWLNMFRIISSRMARHKHVIAFILYLPLDRIGLINGVNEMFRKVGDRHEIENAFGFLTPIDFGKRAVLEYDYYIDQTSREDAEKIGKAMAELGPMLEKLSAETKGVKTMQYILSQGCSRKEHFLYI